MIVRRQHDQTLNARQQSIVAIATFTANGDDSYSHSGGTRRQARGLDGTGQRRTISNQTDSRPSRRKPAYLPDWSINLCTTPKLTPQSVRLHRLLPTQSPGAIQPIVGNRFCAV
ncbi:hypothetical protein [Nostoc sp.]|uniref:hypothetical protein n=1 Tax=Nostoc sp. TaxID=1180 RepID=UPI002FF8563F